MTSSEDGAGWLAFLLARPAARGLSGVQLVTSDDHAGLVNAIAAVLPGAAWQRCRTAVIRSARRSRTGCVTVWTAGRRRPSRSTGVGL